MICVFDILELQRKLTAAALPSGFETPQAKLLAELAAPYVDEVHIDALNNVICHKKGKGKKLMFAAHLDPIGFMVNYIDEKGYLSFTAIGGHNPACLINTRVVFASGAVGGIALKPDPDHPNRNSSAIRMTDLYIDIGAKDKKEAERLAPIGSVAKFCTVPQEIGGGNIMGPYADDLIACVAQLLALEELKGEKCENDLYFVFTGQEETGCKGAKVAAEAIRPYFGVACDVTATGDTPADKKVPMAVALGKGPTIKIKDGGAISSPHANEVLRKVAKKAGIKYQDEVLLYGGTDAGAMLLSGVGAYSTCVSIPCRNIHSPVEIVNKNDVLEAARLLAAAARSAL